VARPDLVFVFFAHPLAVDSRMEEISIPANSFFAFMYVTPFLSYIIDDFEQECVAKYAIMMK
jgi:hypothetical protein